MTEIWGVLAAVLSSGIGGTAVGATRYVMGMTDAVTLAALRFGVGALFLVPLVPLRGEAWPQRRDWPAVVGLGLLFFGLFPILFNAALAFTSAARGALALATLPLLTLLVGAALGAEALTARKTAGVLLAMAGVALALAAGLGHAPPGAWRGDLTMVGAALCMALYNVWSRPLIRRAGAIPFTAAGMTVGAIVLAIVSALGGGLASAGAFGTPQWLAVAYLGVIGSAFVFFLWGFALSRTTPTRVAISVTVNPITASLFGAAVLGEPIGWNIVAGLATVAAGIWLATRDPR